MTSHAIQLQNETILESQLAQKQGGPMISCIPDDDDFPSRGDTDCGTYTDKGCRGFALTSTLRVRARLPSFVRVLILVIASHVRQWICPQIQ